MKNSLWINLFFMTLTPLCWGDEELELENLVERTAEFLSPKNALPAGCHVARMTMHPGQVPWAEYTFTGQKAGSPLYLTMKVILKGSFHRIGDEWEYVNRWTGYENNCRPIDLKCRAERHEIFLAFKKDTTQIEVLQIETQVTEFSLGKVINTYISEGFYCHAENGFSMYKKPAGSSR